MAAFTKSYEFLSAPSQPGDLGTLAHYRVIDELGKGGMGYVFLAEDTKLKRSVALKVMNQKIAAAANSRSRFLSEARAMAAVHHDNVATIFEVGESAGTPFMAMEMLQGETLEVFNHHKHRLGFEKIIDYATQIARGLTAAHAKGIVHRDIKPANIWVAEGNDRVKILDFGLALASTPVDQMAGVGAVVGTPGYLSPEQARSDPLDDRSDLYSLGVVLYELCTGQWPIREKTVSGQLIAILAHRPRPIREINPDIPQPLCDLIQRLLRKEPRTRPSSAMLLEQELQRVKVECHAKSEVAQAISKLQMGLSEVVNKRSAEISFDDVAEVPLAVPENLFDPLGAIPAPITMVPPARPLVKKPPQPMWQAYWPIAAVAGAVLIAIPLMAFAFFRSPKQEIASVDPGQNTTSPPANQNNANTGPNVAASQQPTPRDNRQEQGGNSSDQNKTGQNSASPNRAGPSNTGKPKKPADKAGVKPQGGANPRQANAGKPNPAKQGNQPKRNTAESGRSPKAGSPPAAAATRKPATTADAPSPARVVAPPSSPPVTNTKWTTISIGEGRGADALVEKLVPNQTFGLKPSIGIGARQGVGSRQSVETHHSYLRFDLASIEDVRSHVQSAELILTVLGARGAPVGAVVRVIGIPDVGLWPEEAIEWGNSFSNSGLDSYPLLVETAITAKNVSPEGNRYEIRLSSPELSEFVASSSADTVTLVLAGSGPGSGGVLRFFSRENSADAGPKLRLETPKDPPPKDDKKRR